MNEKKNPRNLSEAKSLFFSILLLDLYTFFSSCLSSFIILFTTEKKMIWCETTKIGGKRLHILIFTFCGCRFVCECVCVPYKMYEFFLCSLNIPSWSYTKSIEFNSENENKTNVFFLVSHLMLNYYTILFNISTQKEIRKRMRFH